ncbi:MAG: acetyl-CoA C-acetyltransferase [Bacillota bacterium]
MDSTKTVIVGAVRTPFGRFGGAFKTLKATELGSVAIREALKSAGVPADQVDYVIMGMVLQGGAGQIPSRQASIGAGLPEEVPSETINKVCISSLRAVSAADQMIRAGDAQLVVAGGMESMSSTPYAMPGGRWGQRMGDGKLVDMMVYDGLTCSFHNVHMGVLGGIAAREHGISREEQDEWSLRSHMKAIAAMQNGLLDNEIVGVEIPQPKGAPVVVKQDESPRADTSLARLAALQPVFDPQGTITAGNAPGISDGATAVVVTSADKATQLGLKPLATIEAHSTAATEPTYIARAPGFAIRKLLAKTGMSVKDIDLFEINEAFAAVPLTCQRMLDWDPEKVNVNGGAIAFGHPIGASGARILMTLIFELHRRGGGYGIAGICGGGAQGDAILVKVTS